MGGVDSTRRLLALARAGDRNALDTLYARYLPRLEQWARGRLPRWARDITDTPDLVQETLLQTLKTIDGFEPGHDEALQAYLRKAVINRIRDEIRKRRRRPELESAGADLAGREPSPLERAIGRQTVERYETALARLRPEDRELLIGRMELGLTYAELAESMSKPSADAARKATQRALVRLIEEMHRGK